MDHTRLAALFFFATENHAGPVCIFHFALFFRCPAKPFKTTPQGAIQSATKTCSREARDYTRLASGLRTPTGGHFPISQTNWHRKKHGATTTPRRFYLGYESDRCSTCSRGANAYTVATSALRLRAARDNAGRRPGSTKQQQGRLRGRKRQGEQSHHQQRRTTQLVRPERRQAWQCCWPHVQGPEARKKHVQYRVRARAPGRAGAGSPESRVRKKYHEWELGRRRGQKSRRWREAVSPYQPQRVA